MHFRTFPTPSDRPAASKHNFRFAGEVISHSQNADVDKRKVEAGRLP